MKDYIVILALCVYVCVFPLLIEVLFCPLDCNFVTYISCNSSIIRKNIQQIAFKFCDNRDEKNMIICDMQIKKNKTTTEVENNTPIMGLTYYLHKQHIKFLSDAKSNYLSF
jgi:hypothetical protein